MYHLIYCQIPVKACLANILKLLTINGQITRIVGRRATHGYKIPVGSEIYTRDLWKLGNKVKLSLNKI